MTEEPLSLALKAIFSVQYIHRDVSTGNMLLFRAPEGTLRGLLVDLEYAKDLDIKSMPDGFRSVRRPALNGKMDQADHPLARELATLWPLKFASRDIFLIPPKGACPMPQYFRHSNINCLHDLESTWWIAIWLTFVFAPNAPSEQDIRNFHALFPPLHTAPRAALCYGVGL
jgi:Fungal protein kinase